MSEIEFFAPWRLVASFADGSRLLFDGLTEQQAKAAMESAQHEHGCISWWDRVTDLNYEDGRYYHTTPESPTLHVVDLAGYDGPVDASGFPAGLSDEIVRQAVEHGAAEGEAQAIIKLHEKQ